MILVRLSKDERFALIGETEQAAGWYTIEPNVGRFIKSIPPGSEVDIRSEKKDNKNHLTFISRLNGSAGPADPSLAPSTPVNSQPATRRVTTRTSSGERSAEVQESIKNQAIGKMVAMSLTSLQGQLTEATIKETITDLFNHYKSLVG